MTPASRPPRLPPPRSGAAPYAIATVCLGNICRSPVAAVLLEHRLDEAGLGDRVRVVSAGTGTWHLGERMDRRAAATLVSRGLDASRHRARQFEAAMLEDVDLVLAMDETNLRDVLALAQDEEAESRVLMFRAFDPIADDPLAGDQRDVPDPWFGGPDAFDLVLAIADRTAVELVDRLSDHLGTR